jgi:polysaccharide export outer membrane protein
VTCHPRFVGWLFVASLLSCAHNAAAQGGAGTSPPPANAAPAPTGPPNPVAIAPPNYLIGPNDRLRITVWNQENISGDYTVSGDGSFTFPLIGRVPASGMTLVALEADLRQRLAAGYFRNPQVTAAVLEYRSKQIFVMGALRNPGAYPMTGDVTIVEAIARAGSTTTEAADHALIIRSQNAQGPVLPGQDGTATVIRVDLRDIQGGQPSSLVMVKDGDTVFVPRASTVFVYGQVRNPGVFPISQETTVRQALALAGGVSEFGAANRVYVLRLENGKEREIKVQLNDVLKPGDTIVVPERYF